MTRRADQGAATALVLACCLVLGVATGFGLLVSATATTRHRMAAAADLAALAAASRVLQPPALACAAAARVARANGGRLTGCEVAGTIATVTVERPAPGWLPGLGSSVGRARAEAIPDISEQPGSTDLPS